jgi:DNA invertase Pin-like site-specific DNA recombinase
MKARYIRTSSSTQNNERQLAKQHQDEKLFIDVVSGAVPFIDREQGQQLINAVQGKEITYIAVSSVDRLGRNTFDIQNTLNWLTEQGVNVHIDNLGLDSLDAKGKVNPIFKMITDVLANVGQMERDAIRERQEEGIKIAKAKKVYKGRLKGTVETVQQKLDKHKDVVKQLKAGKSLRDTAKLCDVSLSTVQRVKGILDKQKTV